MKCLRTTLAAAALLLAGCGGGDDATNTTTTASGAATPSPSTTQSGSGVGGTTTTASGSSAGQLPPACTILTDARAQTVLGPGNEVVDEVGGQGDQASCLYNSLVRRSDSLNGGNLSLSLAETPRTDPPEGAAPLDLGDEAHIVAAAETLTVYVRLGPTLMTLFVQPSPNNPRITIASARDPLIALAREIVAALCPPRC